MNRDLLAIIFAYIGLSQRVKYGIISKRISKIPTSHTYVISLGRKDIDHLFKYSYINIKINFLKYCLKNPLVNPECDENWAIVFASHYGHLEIVKILLSDKRINPAYRNNIGIWWASNNGHLEVVRLLLTDKRVNPTDNNNCAIRWASENGRLEMVKLLLADDRVFNSLDEKSRIKYQKQIQ